MSLLPNQQAADEELSAYKYGPSSHTIASSPLKRFLEKYKRLRTALLIVVLFGACMVIGDGVLTPAISGKLQKWSPHVISCPVSFWMLNVILYIFGSINAFSRHKRDNRCSLCCNLSRSHLHCISAMDKGKMFPWKTPPYHGLSYRIYHMDTDDLDQG